MILTPETLAQLPESILTLPYDRKTVTPGIAHLSVGNFHRAHQAVYVDRALALPGQETWGIVGMGVLDHPSEIAKAEALQSQSGLYTLRECPPNRPDTVRVVKSLVEYVHAPSDRKAALHRLTDPAIRIVTMTITEGGYYTDENGRFMTDNPVIAADIHREIPETVFGLLAEALRLRRDAGTAPFTILSCDNVPANGDIARNAVLSFAKLRDATLAEWIGQNVAFPSCMVDRITPAVRAEDIQRLDAESGIDDRAPLYCEDFIQWVVEDKFPNGRPAWEQTGVLFTDDVEPYERVKLRMLNASHSMLSLPGVLMGYRFVSEAMQDDHLFRLLQQFLGWDAEPHLTAPPGISLPDYGALLLERFRNPAVNDQLLRITSDSTSKLPVFVRPTAEAVVKENGDMRRIAFLLACYCAYLGGRDDTEAFYDITEPRLSDADRTLVTAADPARALDMTVFAGWGLTDNPAFVNLFVAMRTALKTDGTAATLANLVSQPADATVTA
ncbi:mannitol dehydrogenase family protein [Gluconobacter morbifer]|uniref:NADPH-dependent L-sorbose reductase n=1 Tax=Gluconobacter morbifer G707 TaxID=1088869 RepID=G6XJZ3_9PROT|nr:mannitol dehydrogenase family protein [Gluconobacter morbifer]EHH67955.1 NADPH-dependent L-sorbose reductase [Gluconobacter morbifer G707]